MAFSEDDDQRIRASILLKDEFFSQEDKNQAWQDLHSLTSDMYYEVRGIAAKAL